MSTTGAEMIADERQRQLDVEGYTPEGDAGRSYELTRAAHCYVIAAEFSITDALAQVPPSAWPWGDEFWKPSTDPIRNLEKAGALMAAAIDSLRS